MNGIEKALASENKLRIRLKTQDEEFIYKPNKRLFSFYQICQFPVDSLHLVRKVRFNECAEAVGAKEKRLKKEELNKFLAKCPDYKFSVYPTYNFDQIGYPDPNEILTNQSLILNELVE